jgi:hypothetical protein
MFCKLLFLLFAADQPVDFVDDIMPDTVAGVIWTVGMAVPLMLVKWLWINVPVKLPRFQVASQVAAATLFLAWIFGPLAVLLLAIEARYGIDLHVTAILGFLWHDAAQEWLAAPAFSPPPRWVLIGFLFIMGLWGLRHSWSRVESIGRTIARAVGGADVANATSENNLPQQDPKEVASPVADATALPEDGNQTVSTSPTGKYGGLTWRESPRGGICSDLPEMRGTYGPAGYWAAGHGNQGRRQRFKSSLLK